MIKRSVLMVATLLACGAARAAGLQVSPITPTLQPAQQADGLWLSNTGSAQLDAQVRVFRWRQEGGQEQLQATREKGVLPACVRHLPSGGVRAPAGGAKHLATGGTIALAPVAFAMLAHAAVASHGVHADVVHAAFQAGIGIGVRVGGRAVGIAPA